MYKMKSIIIFAVFIIWSAVCLGQEIQPDERGYIVRVGDKIADFEVTMLDGTVKKLSEFDSPVVVLNFFASWCVVCRKEIPHLEKEVWQPFKDKGLLVLGVDYKEKPDTVRKFVAEMKISYPVSLDEDGAIFNRFARGGVTRNIVLDKDLRIIYLTRLFDVEEFNGMKNIILETIGLNSDSLKTMRREAEVMEPVYLKDFIQLGKNISLKYQGEHKVHLEGIIKKKRWWRKLEIGVSLFKDDIVSRNYDKKTKTLRIGYKHYDGVRIAILPMTKSKVPRDIEQVVIYDVK